LETAGSIEKSSKFQPHALLKGVPQVSINRFKLYRKKIFFSKLNTIFKVVKMNFGSQFGAWVSFHTVISQS